MDDMDLQLAIGGTTCHWIRASNFSVVITRLRTALFLLDATHLLLKASTIV